MKTTLRESRLESLLESAQLLHGSLDLDHLLGHLLRTVMARLLVAKGFIAVEGNGHMRLALIRGFPQLKPGDVFEKDEARKAGMEHLMPIGGEENPAGLLGLGRTLKELEEQEEQFLQGLLGIAASGIRNARSHSQTRDLNQVLNQKVQDLRTLLELVQSLTSTLEPQSVAQLLSLTLAGRWAVTRQAIAAFKDGHPPVRREKGIELPEIDLLKDDLANVPEAAFVRNLPECRLKQALEERQAEVLFPLRSGGPVLGVITLGKRMGGLDYTETDLEFGAGLVGQAVVAFENSWHFRDTLEKEKLEQEVNLAATIQQDLFPSSLPKLDGLQLTARSLAARRVGGDYYDVLPIGEPSPSSRRLFCVADVSGKGIPASLLMSSIQATLRALLTPEIALVDLVSRTSALLYATTPANKYATAFLAAVDPASGQIEFVNAGHNDGLLVRANGEIEKLKSTGPPVGLLPGIPFGQQGVELAAGDLLALYSDGVVEAQNADEEEFEEERFLECLRANFERPVDDILERVFECVDAFVGDAPQHDDITLMLIKRGVG